MSQANTTLVITSGEPAGIGPDLCLQLASREGVSLVVLGDPELFAERAKTLGLSPLPAYQHGHDAPISLHPIPLAHHCQAGQLNPANSHSVLAQLDHAATGCLSGDYEAVVTAPVHKGVINEAGIPFTGHTEYFAEKTQAEPLMLLTAAKLRVALVTTHLPLRAVADAITPERVTRRVQQLAQGLTEQFGIAKPHIVVCGLNPHAGEDGHLGDEELRVISPVLDTLRQQGLHITGPVPADTAFTPRALEGVDAVLAMYHDQGLCVLKHAGFGKAVNITLGLPIIRTSVDHGTALSLAGKGQADGGSFEAAIDAALSLHHQRLERLARASTRTPQGSA